MKRVISYFCKCLMVFVIAILIGVFEVSANEISIHDPSVIKDKGKYYLFGTALSAAQSDDLIDWAMFTNGYTAHNNALFGELSQNLAGAFKWAGEDDIDCFGTYSLWAPSVYYDADYVNTDGTRGAYLMYYSASSTYKRSCITLAVSRDIKGPYEYVDTIVYSGFTKEDAYDFKDGRKSRVNKSYLNTNLKSLIESGAVCGYDDDWGINDYNSHSAPNCIDPCIFEDADGRLWMSYGSWSGGIFLLEIDRKNGKAIFPGTDSDMTDRYFGIKIAGGSGKSGEGSFIYYDKTAGYYFLQDTYEWLGEDGGYHIRLFRSTSPRGPYVDALGHSAIYGEHPLEYQGVKLFGNYRFDGMEIAYKSGGHSSALIDDDGNRYLFYHTRFSDRGGMHNLRVHQMFLNEDNWPVVVPYRYNGSVLADCGYFPSEYPGYYQIINHGAQCGMGATYQTATSVLLDEGGTVRGSERGTWSVHDKYITLNLESGVYKGIVFKQFDEANHEVMTFSALGNNNCCIWGSKIDEPIYAEPKAIFPLNGTLGSVRAVCYDTAEKTFADAPSKDIAIDTERGKSVYLDKTFGLEIANTEPMTSYSISMWVKPEGIEQYSPILQVLHDTSGDKWLSLTASESSSDAYLWSRHTENDLWTSVKKEDAYEIGAWQHVIVSVDGSMKTAGGKCVKCFLYINGTKVAEGEAAAGILDEGGSILIGTNPWDANFKGAVREVGIYDYAINNAQAAGIYEAAIKD